MKILPKISFSLLCFLLAACMLTACANTAGSPQAAMPVPAEPAMPQAQEPAGDLTVYLEASFANPLSDHPVYRRILDFKKKYPQVNLTFASPSGGLSDYEAREAEITRLNAELLAGGGPDLFLMGQRLTSCNLFPDLQKSMRNGAFLNCTPWMNAYGINLAGNDYWPCLMQAGQVDGNQYIVPLSFDFLAALADGGTLSECGFSQKSAEKDTQSFLLQCFQAYQKTGMTTNLEEDLSVYLAQPLLDYNSGAVHLGDETVRNMLELNRNVHTNADWMQGMADFLQESRNSGMQGFAPCEARRLHDGKRLFEIGPYSGIASSAWALSALSDQAQILVPSNEKGGITALVKSCGMINANTQNANAAAALLAWLLEEDGQSMGAWPGTLLQAPVLKSAFLPSAAAHYERQKNIWWLSPTPEQKQLFKKQTGNDFIEKNDSEKQEYLQCLGQPLSKECMQVLLHRLEKINAAHLQSFWYDSVSTTQTAGDMPLSQVYQSYLNGDIELDELIRTLTPILELYLYE